MRGSNLTGRLWKPYLRLASSYWAFKMEKGAITTLYTCISLWEEFETNATKPFNNM